MKDNCASAEASVKPSVWQDMPKADAEAFLGEVFGGVHHIPGELKPCGRGWKVNVYGGWLSTFDFNNLTRLVLLAHDRCVRVEVMQGGPGRVGIGVWQRHTREGCMTERHPTIEQALADHRKHYPIETVRP